MLSALQKIEIFVTDFVEGRKTLLRLKTSYGSSNTIAENLQPDFKISFFPATTHTSNAKIVSLYRTFFPLGNGNFNQTASFAQDKDHRFNMYFSNSKLPVLLIMQHFDSQARLAGTITL